MGKNKDNKNGNPNLPGGLPPIPKPGQNGNKQPLPQGLGFGADEFPPLGGFPPPPGGFNLPQVGGPGLFQPPSSMPKGGGPFSEFDEKDDNEYLGSPLPQLPKQNQQPNKPTQLPGLPKPQQPSNQLPKPGGGQTLPSKPGELRPPTLPSGPTHTKAANNSQYVLVLAVVVLLVFAGIVVWLVSATGVGDKNKASAINTTPTAVVVRPAFNFNDSAAIPLEVYVDKKDNKVVSITVKNVSETFGQPIEMYFGFDVILTNGLKTSGIVTNKQTNSYASSPNGIKLPAGKSVTISAADVKLAVVGNELVKGNMSLAPTSAEVYVTTYWKNVKVSSDTFTVNF